MGGAAGAALGAFGWSAVGGPARAARATVTATRLSDRAVLFSGAGCNVLAAQGADGLMLVDSGAPGQTDALMSAVRETFGDQPVHTLFNTHWHLPNTGGNAPLAKAGAEIIAHENTRRWMGMEFRVEWQDRAYQPRPPMARPTQSFYTDGRMALGDRQIAYGHLPRSHTDGDIYVHLPEENILAAGDVVAVGHYPILDYSTGGWIGEMVASLKTILDMSDSNTQIIPGRGSVVGKDHVQRQHDMMATVLERLANMMREGMSAEEMIAEGITKEFDEAWGDPSLFIRNAYLGGTGHYGELRIF